MTKKVTLRKATVADADAIAKVYLASRKQFFSFAPLVHSDERIHQWIYETLIPTTDVTVAEENGIITGMMALSKKEGIGWIDQLYLCPGSTGHKIGSLLINKAKKSLGAPIRLYTFQQNSGARHFYERHGFQVLEFRDGSANEEKCPDVLYEWRL